MFMRHNPLMQEAARESARFLAIEEEVERLLDEAIDETDPSRELELIRKARKLRQSLAG
jgi:hypothetical protein